MNEREWKDQEKARDEIWEFHQSLMAYRDQPTPEQAEVLGIGFDRLFTASTGWKQLNDKLKQIHERRDDLLLVLDRPEIPLAQPSIRKRYPAVCEAPQYQR